MRRAERPQLIPNRDNFEQALAFEQFTEYATKRPADTQQVIADFEAGQPVFGTSQDIADSIEKVLNSTRNGIDINFDSETWDEVLDDRVFAEGVNKFNKTRDVEEQRQIRRSFIVHALGIYAFRLDQYKKPKKNGRVA